MSTECKRLCHSYIQCKRYGLAFDLISLPKPRRAGGVIMLVRRS